MLQESRRTFDINQRKSLDSTVYRSISYGDRERSGPIGSDAIILAVRLNGVSERRTILQHFALLICLAILPSEDDSVNDNNNDDESIACHSGVETWAIMG